MSLNVIPIKTIRTVDQVLDLKDTNHFSVFDGGRQITYQQFPAEGNSLSQVNIVCNPPSEKVVIHPIIYQEFAFKITYQATNNQLINRYAVDVDDPTKPVAEQRPIADAPRQFPLSQVLSSTEVRLNNTSFTEPLSQYFNGFIRYANDFNIQDALYSSTASQLDQGLSYDDMFLTNRSPFGKYEDNVIQQPRGSFAKWEVVSNPVIAPTASGQAEMRLTVYEPILISPLFFSKGGLSQIRTMNYNSVLGNLHRLVCRSPTNGNATNPPLPLTALVFEREKAQLHFKYISPKLLDDIPRRVVYPYNDLLITTKEAGASTPAGGIVELNMNAINLSAVPRRVYVYARERDTDIQGLANLGKTDAMMNTIERIDVNYANVNNILSSASAQDLYQIARENGSNLSWSEWTKSIGSVLALDFGKDIGLGELEAPGMLDNPQFSCKLQIKNITNRSVHYVLNVIFIYEGSVTFFDGDIIKQIAVLNKNDVLNSQTQDKTFIAHDPKNYFGGIGLGPILAILKGIRKGAQIGAPIVKGIADFAEKAGLGRAPAKRKYKKKAGRIGGRIGGKAISRADLMEYM
jgi:hypothetical protein